MISVIVPVYNVKKYVEACVSSIRSQTYKELEIILVDDGSTDGSSALCDTLAESDDRIKVVHKKNGGLSDARNAGMEVATGQYFLFVDGDDRIHPQMVETLFMAAKQTGADMTISSFVRCSELEAEGYIRRKVDTAAPGGPGFMVQCEAVRGEKIASLIYENSFPDPAEIIVAWNKLYRRELFETIRYPKGKLHEDEYIIHELLNQCKTVTYVPYALYFYLQRGESITGRWSTRRSRDSEEALRLRMAYYLEQSNAANLPEEKEQKKQLYIFTAQRWVDVIKRNYKLAGELPGRERRAARKELRKKLQEMLPELNAQEVNRRAELIEYRIWSRWPWAGDRVRALHEALAGADHSKENRNQNAADNH